MFVVTRKKYDAMIRAYAVVHEQYDRLVRDHLDLVHERDGLKIGMQTLRSELTKVSNEFYLYKKNREKEN
jgi:hypothetical protein